MFFPPVRQVEEWLDMVKNGRLVPSVLWQAIQKGLSKSSALLYYKSMFMTDRHDMVWDCLCFGPETFPNDV